MAVAIITIFALLIIVPIVIKGITTKYYAKSTGEIVEFLSNCG